MMKTETKKKWLEALRSGKYIQSTRVLKNEHGGFCCLGVLHDVTKGTWYKRHGNFYCGSRPRENSDEAILLGPFLQGLDAEFATRLAEMNDKGSDFDLIANIIEAEVKTK